MQYMVIEKFKSSAALVYKRFHARGRLMPDGLNYVDSWLSEDMSVCYQIVETADPNLIAVWISRWSDLVEFEITPIMSGKEAAKRLPS